MYNFHHDFNIFEYLTVHHNYHTTHHKALIWRISKDDLFLHQIVLCPTWTS